MLASVVVRKPIASVGDRASIFTYIALDELLEAEAGTSANEPKQIAIEQATEKAVMALIAEGASIGLWDFANQSAGNAYISAYLQQKFDGNVLVGATRPQAPRTINASYVPKTTPRPPRARQVRRVVERRVVPPAPAAEPAASKAPPLPPNTPESDEVIGKIEKENVKPVT